MSSFNSLAVLIDEHTQSGSYPGRTKSRALNDPSSMDGRSRCEELRRVVSLTVCLSNNILEPLTHEQFQILPDKHTVEATLPRDRCQTLYGCVIVKEPFPFFLTCMVVLVTAE